MSRSALSLALLVGSLAVVWLRSSDAHAWALPGKCDRKASLHSFTVPQTDSVHGARSYYEYAPSTAPTSLVISLHGAIANPDNAEYGFGQYQEMLSCFNDVADANPVAIVYPNGYRGNWATGLRTEPDRDGYDDVAFLSALISAELAAHPTIDPHRVFVSGMSNGGFMAHQLACRHPEQVAAVADAAGGMKVNPACVVASHVAYIGFHGTDDMAFKYGTPGDTTVELKFSFPTEVISIWSAEGNAIEWGKRNGCGTTFTWTRIDPSDPADATYVMAGAIQGCPAGAAVQFNKVVNGGHTWPGVEPTLPNWVVGPTTTAVHATTAMWNFFKAHPKP